ncbi:MAG: SDR family NAD(P)-dependent oxidoreductase [Acidimicrobiales bacterium]
MATPKSVLITGGTGSFGHKMARRLLDSGYEHIRIFSRDEAKQHQMRVDFSDSRLEFHVGDVRERQSVDAAMAGIDLVFHAAALKQVPSCEFFPLQAVLTNVLGSANVVESAQRAGVETVVCLSTDKAVMPVNAMGMTKALMEKVAQALSRRSDTDTVVCSVRYGNVMYSRGSVIPLFVQQIREGKPLTVTDPDMTRFLLPLEVAVELVEYAFTHARQGDTFIRKAPAATIGVLAEAVCQLMGADNPIEKIGVRHGEKLYETLATQEELRHAEDLGEYWRLQMDDRGLDYDQFFSEGEAVPLSELEDYHSHNTERLDLEATKELLMCLPEVREAIALSEKS